MHCTYVGMCSYGTFTGSLQWNLLLQFCIFFKNIIGLGLLLLFVNLFLTFILINWVYRLCTTKWYTHTIRLVLFHSSADVSRSPRLSRRLSHRSFARLPLWLLGNTRRSLRLLAADWPVLRHDPPARHDVSLASRMAAVRVRRHHRVFRLPDSLRVLHARYQHGRYVAVVFNLGGLFRYSSPPPPPASTPALLCILVDNSDSGG